MMILPFIKGLIISLVLIDLAAFIGELIDNVVSTKNKLLGVIKTLLVYLLTCEKCFTFWFSLISGWGLFLSCLIALGVYYIKNFKMTFFDFWNIIYNKKRKTDDKI